MKPPINYDTPRIIVMHEWPGMPDTLKVGDVLTRDYMLNMPEKDPVIVYRGKTLEQCILAYEVDRTIASGSNCLKQLAWFGERYLKDMPEYLRYKGVVNKVEKYIGINLVYMHSGNDGRISAMLKDCKPATEVDFQVYIQSLNQPKP